MLLVLFSVPLEAQHKTVTLATTDLTNNEIDTIATGGYDIGKNYDIFSFWVTSDSVAACDLYFDYSNGSGTVWATYTDSLVTTSTTGVGRNIPGRDLVTTNIGFGADFLKRVRVSKRATLNGGATKTFTLKVSGIKIRN